MCSLSPSLPHNTFAGPGVRARTSGGVDGHYSAGHKETGNLPLHPGARTAHTQLPRGWEAQPEPAFPPYTTAPGLYRRQTCGLSEKSCPPSGKCPRPKQNYVSRACFSESLNQGGVTIPRSAHVRAAPTDSGRTCLNPPALPRASALGHQAQWPASHSRRAPASRSRPHCHAPSLYLVRPHVHTALPHFPQHGPWLGRDGRALCSGTGTVTSI